MTDARLVLTTTPNAELAHQIAEHLVSQQLVACGQIDGPITSVYRWQGVVHRDQEFRLLCKTHAKHIDSIEREIKRLHSYECPQFVVLAIEHLSADYFDWLLQQVSSP